MSDLLRQCQHFLSPRLQDLGQLPIIHSKLIKDLVERIKKAQKDGESFDVEAAMYLCCTYSNFIRSNASLWENPNPPTSPICIQDRLRFFLLLWPPKSTADSDRFEIFKSDRFIKKPGNLRPKHPVQRVEEHT